jgi:CelD/BcsL family acetyltransferase involved in cellulose biosynthesis
VNLRGIEKKWLLLSEKNGNFFLSPFWLNPWARNAEREGKLLVAVAGEGDKPVGMAFFSLEGKRLGFLAQDYSYHLDFLAEKGFETEVAERILEFVFSLDNWESILLRHNVDCPAFLEVLREKCREHGFALETGQGDACSAIELPDSMEKYFAGLKKKLRKNLKNDLSRLEKEFSVETKVFSGMEGFDVHWEDFLRLHFENMERKGEKTVLAEPLFRDACRQACLNAAEQGELRFLNLELGGKLAGSLLAIEHCGIFSVLNIGFGKDYGSKQSLGNVLFLKAIEYCCSKGIKKFDLLGGNPEYKARFGASLVSGLEIRVFRAKAAQKADALKRNAKKSVKKILGRA